MKDLDVCQCVQLVLSWFNFREQNHSVMKLVELKLISWAEIDW